MSLYSAKQSVGIVRNRSWCLGRDMNHMATVLLNCAKVERTEMWASGAFQQVIGPWEECKPVM